MDKMRISATSDIVFKFLFGSRSSTKLLRDFLNAVMADSGDPTFEELEILNPINDKQYVDDKLSIIDVRARDSKGTAINVEVQVRNQVDFQERSLSNFRAGAAEAEVFPYRASHPPVDAPARRVNPTAISWATTRSTANSNPW